MQNCALRRRGQSRGPAGCWGCPAGRARPVSALALARPRLPAKCASRCTNQDMHVSLGQDPSPNAESPRQSILHARHCPQQKARARQQYVAATVWTRTVSAHKVLDCCTSSPLTGWRHHHVANCSQYVKFSATGRATCVCWPPCSCVSQCERRERTSQTDGGCRSSPAVLPECLHGTHQCHTPE